MISVIDLDASGRSAKEADAVVFLVKGSVKMPGDHGSDMLVTSEDVPELRPVGELADRVVAQLDSGMVER